jgi:16S rRNA (uracil1498-N3)-methyltransferase
MPLFIIKNNPGFLKPIVLEKEDEHHLVRVLRVKLMDVVDVVDNCGQRAQTKVMALNPLRLEILERIVCPPPHPVTVCLPLIDQTRLEWAVEKLCELNVQTVQLISTERTQTKSLSAKKMERLHKIAEASQKQCERAWPLKIDNAIALKNTSFVEVFYYFVGLTPNDTDKHRPTRTNTDKKPATSNQRPATVFIGPEGGFTNAEINFLLQKKVTPLSLPTNILRTETAAIALVVSILNS